MHQVGLDAHTKVAADRAGVGLPRLGHTAQAAHRLHAVHPFQADGDYRGQHHKGLDLPKERQMVQVCIVLVEQRVCEAHHLHADDFEALALEA